MRFVFLQLGEYTAANGSDKMKKNSWFLQSIMEELLDEMADYDAIRTGLYFAYFGKLMEWVGSGNVECLPDELKEWLGKSPTVHEAIFHLSEEVAKQAEDEERLAIAQ